MGNPKVSKSVFCAIVCPSANIGLFIRQPDKSNPMWKIAAGDVMPGESIEAALRRETSEETGFDIPSRQSETGLVLGNDDFQLVSFGVKEVPSRNGGIHEKHYFAVIVKDPREIIALDGQLLKEDITETIETKVFALDKITTIPDFLYGQRKFLEQVLAHVEKINNG